MNTLRLSLLSVAFLIGWTHGDWQAWHFMCENRCLHLLIFCGPSAFILFMVNWTIAAKLVVVVSTCVCLLQLILGAL